MTGVQTCALPIYIVVLRVDGTGEAFFQLLPFFIVNITLEDTFLSATAKAFEDFDDLTAAFVVGNVVTDNPEHGSAFRVRTEMPQTSIGSFSGEGIGKALETGLLAADALVAARGGDDAAVRARYEASLQAIKPKFDLYELASHVNHRPWLTDLVVWRANASPRILARMSGVLEGTQTPGRLLSWKGIFKLMFE